MQFYNLGSGASNVSFIQSVLSTLRRAIQGPEAQQQPMGQEESELASDQDVEGSLTLTSYQDHQGGQSPLSASGERTRSWIPLECPVHVAF